ncbi:MAG TPA: ferredoxin [Candidatus Paceibacterota bacterium]|nr:ferredoxin [Candidatus Paceibacterota bacterium]HPT40194.1 ferredoxin [Candidatus Paceibacterota bacterium]
MTKKIIVNKNKCIGCGTCVALASDIFEMDKNGKSKVKESPIIDEESLKLAIDSCPAQAINIQK